nr:MAG TPA: ChiA1-BD-binding domain protein [Bacteriophage sp.]
MYAVSKEGVFVGYADSVVSIRLHENGSYVPCADDEADGFCAKMAVSMKDEDGNEYHSLSDTVFCLAGHELRGTEPVGSYEEMGAAIPLTEAESAVGAVVALTGEVVTAERAAELRPMIEMAAMSLSDGEAATAVELFPKWAYPVSYIVGNRVSDSGKLYKCRKAHTSQERWNPAATPDLWVVIDVTHAGTQDDPIPASRGMEYEYGKYYLDSEDGKTYLCERTGEAAGGKIVLQYLPHELVGNYFKAV